MKIVLVAAIGDNLVIGRDGQLPWHLKSDLQHFRKATLNRPVIMGRKTWESLPKRPLVGRTNIVLSRDGSFEPRGAVVCEEFGEAVSIGREQAEEDGAAEVCVIGGLALFAVIWGSLSRPSVHQGIAAEHIRLAPEAHGQDVVTVILADFRGLDTLAEITVLAVAVVGVATLLRRGRLW